MIKKFKGLEKVKKIHMIGIGGVSMSGIAIILQKAGYEGTGSDKNEGDMIDILTKNGIPVFIGSNAEWVKDADIVLLDAENDIADVFVGGNLIER